VAGLTLGGGLGWLLGSYGAACDHLSRTELVTADGSRLQVDHDSHPDLDWALSGGGGNFGVVTALELQLTPVREVLAGPIGFRVQNEGGLANLLRSYREMMADAPDQLAVELNAFDRNGPLVVALVCWCGLPAEGARVLASLRLLGAPLFNRVRPVDFARFADQPATSRPSYLYRKGASLDALTDALEAQIHSAPPGWSFGLGHVMHGQVVRAAQEATPLVRQPGRMAYFLGAGWTDAAEGGATMSWLDAAMADLATWSSPATYVNYLSDDRPAAIEAAYGPNLGRLRTVKRHYDPDNVFRRNRNIRP